MEKVLDVVISGSNLLPDVITSSYVKNILSNVDQKLEAKGYVWNQVSLLLLANSKLTDRQQEGDQAIIAAITQHCHSKDWFPSLIGASVRAGFYTDEWDVPYEIDNGIIFAAFIIPVLNPLPVSVIVSDDPQERANSAAGVVKECISIYQSTLKTSFEIDQSDIEVLNSTSGILFTTGVGYIEEDEFIDFRQAFQAGQSLIEEYSEANIVGGASSNRGRDQSQTIYYSLTTRSNIEYRFTNSHSAVFCLLPYSQPSMFIDHPYQISNETPLDVIFSNHKQFSEGRYFYIRGINGQDPIQFFQKLWPISLDELDEMEVRGNALAAEPRTFGYTLGSTKSIYDGAIWPNIPSRIETVNNERCMRIIRAETSESNYYLMKMTPESLLDNSHELIRFFENNIGGDSFILSFLCESRWYYQQHLGIKDEQEILTTGLPAGNSHLGLYLNGEYSLGSRKSIGYHNFSMITSIHKHRSMSQLPYGLLDKLMEMTNIRIFLSHSSRDKSVVREIGKLLDEELQGYIDYWIDEEMIKTGAQLRDVIVEGINNESDYFIVFISRSSIESEWVRDEVQWGIEKEQDLGRTFILPVLLDDIWSELELAWDSIDVNYLTGKKYLKCLDHDEATIAFSASRLSKDIKYWIKRDQTTHKL